MELTILMPCLNEAETIEICVTKALQFLNSNSIDGEVLISDNGSTDRTIEIAERAGARVIFTPTKGYGSALINGIHNAHGEFIIMGDADDSYDFSTLEEFVVRLQNGADLVMGNRFSGEIMPGAMPLLHRFVGNPILSMIARIFFKSNIGDFHCGLRGFQKSSIQRLNLISTGMEFASEMAVKASIFGLRIEEVPITLRPDGRSRKPHLRTWRDGWRHLRLLMLYSPRWLFLYPGLLAFLVGATISARLSTGSLPIGSIVLDVNTLLVCIALSIVGYQSVWFAVLSKTFAVREGLVPMDNRIHKIQTSLSFEKLLCLSVAIVILGLSGLWVATIHWGKNNWGPLELSPSLRLVIPSAGLLVIGAQTALGAAMLSIFGLGRQISQPYLEVRSSDVG